jgi:hypothetical protein
MVGDEFDHCRRCLCFVVVVVRFDHHHVCLVGLSYVAWIDKKKAETRFLIQGSETLEIN